MEDLFTELRRLARRQFSLQSTPLPSHRDQVHKSFQAEEIRINGKKHRIRRVFLAHPSYPSYRHIGWVLYGDIHSCMICSKKFLRIVGKRDKCHCKICGNIVCKSCLTGMVLIREIPEGYVEACSNCYWGQDEISITQTQENFSDLMTPNSPPLTGCPGDHKNEFWNDLEIEEYDGPSTFDSSQLVAFSPLANPPLIPEPNSCDDLSTQIPCWSVKESLVEEDISQVLSAPSVVAESSDDSENSEDGEEEEDESEAEGEGELNLEEEEESPLIQQTAYHAQLMLLLMSLSVATGSNDLTEEEARKLNRESDRIAREMLRESPTDHVESHDV